MKLIPYGELAAKDILGVRDIVVSAVFLIIFYSIAYSIKNKKINVQPEYSYFIKGLSVKLFASIFFCLVYVLYYQGGDTTNFFGGAVALVNLAYKTFNSYLTLLFDSSVNWTHWYDFDGNTGYPPRYMYKDPKTFSIIRFTSVLQFFCFQSYVGVTLLLSFICYFGIFRFYQILVELYPNLKKEFAIAVLFMPSVIFWGSGLLKDTYTFAGLCWFVSSFYNIIFKQQKIILNTIYIIISLYIIYQIKAYIINAFLPGALLWAAFNKIKSMKNQFLKYFVAPLVIITITVMAFQLTFSDSNSSGNIAIEQTIDEALVIQNDLKRDVYGENSFDIGEVDASLVGILSKAPLAIEAGLFRPHIWEANTIFMLLSALENIFMMFLLIKALTKFGPFGIMRVIRNEPYVAFALLFTILFSFSIGFSTPNFGALVRYKIPAIPFYVSAFYIILSKGEKKGSTKKKI